MGHDNIYVEVHVAHRGTLVTEAERVHSLIEENKIPMANSFEAKCVTHHHPLKGCATSQNTSSLALNGHTLYASNSYFLVIFWD